MTQDANGCGNVAIYSKLTVQIALSGERRLAAGPEVECRHLTQIQSFAFPGGGDVSRAENWAPYCSLQA